MIHANALTRRSFLATLGAAATGFAARRQERGAYRIGLETYSFHDVDLETTLKHVRGLGLSHIELHEGHLPHNASRERMASARRMLADAGVTAAGIYIHDEFTDSEEIARPILAFARTMGFQYINGAPRPESLPVLNRIAREYGVRIAIHNHGPGATYETLEHLTSALKAHPSLVPCIDIGHFARSRVDPVRAVRALGARAVAIHIKDVDAGGQNTVVGEGTIDMPGVFAGLRSSGFDGLVVLEYEGDLDNMEKRLSGMRASLANMRRYIDDSRRP